MANDINELRAMMFDTIRDLRCNRMDIEQARAISDMAGRVIDSARMEVEFVKALGVEGTGFVRAAPALPAPEAPRGRMPNGPILTLGASRAA